jgi:hypothetical protein
MTYTDYGVHLKLPSRAGFRSTRVRADGIAVQTESLLFAWLRLMPDAEGPYFT